MNLNDFNFAHIGSDLIARELQYNITSTHYRGYQKPIGGLWTSPFYNIQGSISDWTDLLLENINLYYKFPSTKGCLLHISNDANICNLTTDIEVNQIKEKYQMNVLDFEELSPYYDAFFVHPWKMSYNLRNEDFQKWQIRTLLISNLDIIESYLPITIRYDGGFFIKDIGNLEKIEEPSNDYYELCDFVHQFYEDRLSNSFEETKLTQLEHEIYPLLQEQIHHNLHPRIQNSEIFKTILFNEKQKQYQKRKS